MPASKVARYFILACMLLMASCNFPAGTQEPANSPEITATPFQPIIGAQNPKGTVLEESEVESQEAVANWWISPNLPLVYRELLTLPEGAQVTDEKDQAHLLVSVNEGETISQWVYALVAPFPTLVDEVSYADLQAAWQGKGSEPFSDSPLMMSAETEAVFRTWWGQPGEGAVRIEGANQLLETAWSSQPAWAIVPFNEVQPKWKMLAVEGQSPIWKTFDIAKYPLSVPIGLSGDPTLLAEALARFGPETATPLAPASNRDADKLTTVILTGVTALVRATAYEMNRSGVTYPAEDIGFLLKEADITHISNEVPFAQDCPAPDPVQRTLIFCSDARYIDLLEAVGADVIELTGDHFNDWSREAMLFTLELYKERGWRYYGGGANIEEAREPLTLEHNGNKIAFIGCNGKGGGYASADVDYPGAAECDYELMETQVRELVAQGYLVIATFQHNEYYTFIPQPTMIRDFARISGAGAAIVSGSQAHQSHGMEFPRDDAIIMYGLGNLFFDQRNVVDNGDKALIARHVFYDGRYISTDLFTTQFVDFAKPRFMTAEEREAFLSVIFDASIWHEGE
jgi:poly-gamma-glutamate synthesis protein (capsule biosynthesis protein)